MCVHWGWRGDAARSPSNPLPPIVPRHRPGFRPGASPATCIASPGSKHGAGEVVVAGTRSSHAPGLPTTIPEGRRRGGRVQRAGLGGATQDSTTWTVRSRLCAPTLEKRAGSAG